MMLPNAERDKGWPPIKTRWSCILSGARWSCPNVKTTKHIGMFIRDDIVLGQNSKSTFCPRVRRCCVFWQQACLLALHRQSRSPSLPAAREAQHRSHPQLTRRRSLSSRIIHSNRNYRCGKSSQVNDLKQCWGSVTFWNGSGSGPLTNGCGSGSGSCYFRH